MVGSWSEDDRKMIVDLWLQVAVNVLFDVFMDIVMELGGRVCGMDRGMVG